MHPGAEHLMAHLTRLLLGPGVNVVCPQFRVEPLNFFLQNLGYLLNRKEGKPGTPERPLSALGKITYMSYWKDSILEFLSHHDKPDVSVYGKDAMNLHNYNYQMHLFNQFFRNMCCDRYNSRGCYYVFAIFEHDATS